MMIMMCDPWASYLRHLEHDMIRQELEHELMMDLEHEEEMRDELIEDPDSFAFWTSPFVEIPVEIVDVTELDWGVAHV